VNEEDGSRRQEEDCCRYACMPCVYFLSYIKDTKKQKQIRATKQPHGRHIFSLVYWCGLEGKKTLVFYFCLLPTRNRPERLN
jgi:hypothetical protein